MSEHEKQTEFLKQCLRYDESPGHQELVQEIGQIQRDERCVWRAVWLMAGLTALATAGFVYPTILLDNFPSNAPHFFVNLIFVLGVASLISLLAFVSLGGVYRRRLDWRREKCRRLITRFLESRLGKPVATPFRNIRDHHVGGEDERTVRVANETKDFPVKIESAAKG